jgi:cell volume regulation protein A
MRNAHELILVGGALGLLSLFAGLSLARRFGAPLLLVFLVLGLLAGEDGPGGIQYNNYDSAYLIGSAALAIILFEGGLKTDRTMLRLAAVPAVVLATIGVAISAGIVGLAAWWLGTATLLGGLLIGAIVAPTDAAAVAVMLRGAKIRLPERLLAILEVESGLNDPMAVFLTMLLVELLIHPGSMDGPHGVLLFLEEMAGGVAFGLGGGAAIRWLIRRLRPGTQLAPTLAMAAALALFGGAQLVGASGFIALYLAGAVVGDGEGDERAATIQFFDALSWLAQIALFLMLGLLVTPHDLIVLPNLVLALVLIFVARPVACLACLLPLRVRAREAGFASWVGLRGAVPIYLAIIPVLQGVPGAAGVFGAAFVIVVASLIIQGWTIRPVARLLRVEEAERTLTL